MNKLTTGWVEAPLQDLIKAEWNYKKDDDTLLEKLKNNIKKNGVIENILIREYHSEEGDLVAYEVVNGNHRLEALVQLGTFETIHAYNLGNINELEAKRIAIETNETRFQSSGNALDNIIKELLQENDVSELASTLPYEVDTLDVLSYSESEDDVEDLMDGINTEYEMNEGIASLTSGMQAYEPQELSYTFRFNLPTNDLYYELSNKLNLLGVSKLEGVDALDGVKLLEVLNDKTNK